MSLKAEESVDLKAQVKERGYEIDLLNAFINRDPTLSSDAVIVHGYKSVGKTLTVTSFLDALNVKYSRINCDECVSKKILLQRCFNRIRKDSGVQFAEGFSKADYLRYGRLGENFSTFISALEQFIRETEYSEHHVLILDRFDQCMEATDELFASFLKLREQSMIPNITIVVIISGDDPREVATLATPHIYFRAYTEDQVIRILQETPLCKFNMEDLDGTTAGYEFWCQYVKVIVDLFFQYCGSDMTILKDISMRLWDRFIEPVKSGELKVTEFVKVYKQNVDLFTSDNIISNSAVRDFKTLEEEKQIENGNVEDLPLHSKFFLLASYLASYIEQRNDLQKFSKVKGVKYKKRASTTVSKRGHLLKEDIDTRLLSPNFVDLERILAILSVIYRNYAPSLNRSDKDELLYIDDEIIVNEEKKEIEKAKFTLTSNIDLNNQIATLFSLGLLSKSASSDILGARLRWKCNINWPTAEGLAKLLNFPIAEFLNDN
ncbi:uncharacterized protein SPAPADRAFT_148516 [Spathaspora passalidarum NRRL Y-27907]|uniref:Uncharacterized protein n=1 Tax=Spathaspora passalidarum (strain NRRL Y-27907 / 11-Y1) TaxID=619300 RepID=G3AHD7_SPAPN|nr:uncharacterized protein SPAPADRAFT_148516 [Spathaspora passalidarum NRRL Y-27907]EGW34101.1 hypothetical protein SPAPADRAFT_148516 [Spathaspora passalidarum NRRL Y-27907]